MDHIELDRDKNSGGVIVKDTTALSEYKNKKNLLRQKDKKIKNLENRINIIEKELKKRGFL